MSLSDRLRKIEARLTALEQGQKDTADMVVQIAEAVEAEEVGDTAPSLTLDGEHAGGERDQSQEL